MVRRTMTCLVVALLLFAASAHAQMTFTCEFNESTQQLDYSVANGPAGVELHLSIVTQTGCVQLGVAPNLTGPDDNASVDVSCIENRMQGYVQVDICDDFTCFKSFHFSFVCDDACDISASPGVSAHTPWGLGVLLGLFVVAGAVIIRRYR